MVKPENIRQVCRPDIAGHLSAIAASCTGSLLFDGNLKYAAFNSTMFGDSALSFWYPAVVAATWRVHYRIQIPLIVGSLLGLHNLKQQGCLLYDGPFPDQFVLAFDR